jgi:hypothetical protein
MFGKSVRLIMASAAALLLASCGGGGGGGNNPPANVAPTANAGPAQTVSAGATVTLNGTGSSDSDGTIATYAWTQTLGGSVILSSTSATQPTFVAPAVTTATQLRFSLVVTDNDGASSGAATVNITVNPVTTALTGTVRFQRVPLNATGTPGLKFASQVYQPARGVTVQALNAANLAVVLATGATDPNGAYSLNVAANTNVVLRVSARMTRDATQPLPRWDVRVQNGTANTAPFAPYTFDSAPFNTSTAPATIDIPSGHDATGAVTGTRASAPFAILDTIYASIQAVVAVQADANFPALYVDWGTQSNGTFFTTGNGQHIALLSDITEDTDEFDRHVVSHEFGHYLEHNFARSDSIGGPHGLGDRLDLRVAFGEGFGYAFSAIALNDPVVLDSFVNGGQHVAGGFHIELDPPIGGSDGPGCWCSESTVWSFLWDLHDGVVGVTDLDGDGIALGFLPIWQLLTGPQRTTPALTSVFSFVTALKQAQPAVAAQIDARMALNNIVSPTMDAFATTETSTPIANTLPMYTTLSLGVPAVVFNSGTTGPPDRRYNKVGNRRFLRFTPVATGPVTVTVGTSNPNANPDPDFIVFREGTIVALGFDAPPGPEVETFTAQAGQTYIIDAYDCANGCDPDPPQGTAGDYNLTVTVN